MGSLAEWIASHWGIPAGGAAIGALGAALRFLPRLVRRLAEAEDCEWHRAQGLAREKTLEARVTRAAAEQDRLYTELDRLYAVLARGGGSAGSASATPRTTPTRTRSRKNSSASPKGSGPSPTKSD